MSFLNHTLYRTAHLPYFADCVYTLARPVQAWLDRYRSFQSRQPHQKIDLEELRSFLPMLGQRGLAIVPTNICNARCCFCAYPKIREGASLGVMDFSIFKKAVDEYVALQGKSISFTPTLGEALIDPGLVDKIQYAAATASVKAISLYSNGILLLQNDLYHRLIDSGLTEIGISTPGCDAEIFRRVYGVDVYPKVMEGLRCLLGYNRQCGEKVAIQIRFRNAQAPRHILHSPDFRRVIQPFLSERVRVNFTIHFDNWGGTVTPDDLIGTMRMKPPRSDIKIPCMGLLGFFVLHDGSVRLCGCRVKKTEWDDLIVGNIREQSLAEIVCNEKSLRIIEGFYNGERPETCRQCTVYTPITRRALQHWHQAF